MKVCVIQPPYSADYERSDECFERQLELMSQCDDKMDIIVLPEAADVPSLAKNLDERMLSNKKFNKKRHVKCEARRVFVPFSFEKRDQVPF